MERDVQAGLGGDEGSGNTLAWWMPVMGPDGDGAPGNGMPGAGDEDSSNTAQPWWMPVMRDAA